MTLSAVNLCTHFAHYSHAILCSLNSCPIPITDMLIFSPFIPQNMLLHSLVTIVILWGLPFPLVVKFYSLLLCSSCLPLVICSSCPLTSSFCFIFMPHICHPHKPLSCIYAPSSPTHSPQHLLRCVFLSLFPP